LLVCLGGFYLARFLIMLGVYINFLIGEVESSFVYYKWYNVWFERINHKDIGPFYLNFGFWPGMVDAGLSILIRADRDQLCNGVISSLAIIIFFMLMSSAPDMSFPRWNNASYWLMTMLVLSARLINSSCGTGWTVYPPLNTNGHLGNKIDLAIFSLHCSGSILGGIYFMVFYGCCLKYT
uniref:Cytochrome c oxidase subunit 1 n=1 Tax=Dracunculus medinensis TaxID=318479 RepID=A0A0N4UR94_DRAME